MKLLAIFMLVVLFGCVLPEKRSCKYSNYDETLQDTVVIPYLKQKFGDGYRYFNYDDPVISIKRDQVAYVFLSSKTVDARNFRYEKSIYVIRSCVDGEVLEITEVGFY